MQEQLFYDTYDDAIRDTIMALGGFKKVGSELWPAVAVDEAGRRLSHCLNVDKRDKLDFNELALIRKLARQANCHILAAYEMQAAGYAPPQPIEPEDEQAALMRQFIEAQKGMANIAKQMERAGLLKVVA